MLVFESTSKKEKYWQKDMELSEVKSTNSNFEDLLFNGQYFTCLEHVFAFDPCYVSVKEAPGIAW